MDQFIIDLAVKGLGQINPDNLAKLISFVDAETALAILGGKDLSFPELQATRTLNRYSSSKEVLTIRNATYNPIMDKVHYEYMEYNTIYGSVPFAPKSDEFIELSEKIALLDKEAAENLLSAFSGSRHSFKLATVRWMSKTDNKSDFISGVNKTTQVLA